MKYLMILFLSFPLLVSAQECKLIRETDPFTKEKKISSGFIQLDGASVTIDASRTEIDFLFSVEGADRCYDNNSNAMIFFEGTKTKTNNRNGGSMNCEGLFHFIFKNSTTPVSLLTKLTTMKVSHIVFTGNNKKEADIIFSPTDQLAFMTLANCVLTEGKSLLQ